MLGHIALGRADLIDDVLDANLVVAQGAKDFEPQGVGHGLEAMGRLCDIGFLRDQRLLRFGHVSLHHARIECAL